MCDGMHLFDSLRRGDARFFNLYGLKQDNENYVGGRYGADRGITRVLWFMLEGSWVFIYRNGICEMKMVFCTNKIL